LDIACYLALLQEDNFAQTKGTKQFSGRFIHKSSFQGALPLPRPPLQTKSDNVPDDKSKAGIKIPSVEDKIAALAAYRMAKGLCRRCGEKWFKGHKCAESV
jgi:hypothetical protein